MGRIERDTFERWRRHREARDTFGCGKGNHVKAQEDERADGRSGVVCGDNCLLLLGNMCE